MYDDDEDFEEETEQDNGLFPFDSDEMQYILEVTRRVKQLLSRDHLRPKEISSISKALLGLQRLPQPTTGLSVHIELVYSGDHEVNSCELYIDESAFRTAWIKEGYVQGPYGGDSYDNSETALEVEYGGYHSDARFMTLMAWLSDFEERQDAELRITDNSDDSELNWEDDDGSEFWRMLP
jgi:hypothetical protein